MNRQLVSLKYDYHNARNTKLKAVRVTLTTTLASFTHNLANQKIEFSLYLTTSRLRVPKQQQQQYLLAFPWIHGIVDYNIDYVKVKEKKKEKKVTFIIVNNNNNNNNNNKNK